MLEVIRTQSLSAFRNDPSETLRRLQQTGELEVLVEDGERQAVVMSPAAFDAIAADIEYLEHTRRLQQASQEFDEGKGIDVDVAFAQMREQLLREFSEIEPPRD